MNLIKKTASLLKVLSLVLFISLIPNIAQGATELYTWGSDSQGALGDGQPDYKVTPVQPTGLTGVTEISSRSAHALALKSDGTVWGWGKNDAGQVGDETRIRRLTPAQVSGLTGVTDISTGVFHSSVLKSDGTVWAWGSNSYGQRGDGGTTASKTTPVQVSGLTGVTAISAGGYQTFALKSDGTVWAWGKNNAGQLGDGTQTNRSTPVQVSGLTGVTAISAGESHSIALKSDGTVWTWGHNYYGQLGDGTTTSSYIPLQVSSFTGVTAISAGQSHSLALKSDGTVWAWGKNTYGMLGDGTTAHKSTPVQVSGLTGVAAISAGMTHSFALKSDDTAWSWGDNGSAQLGDGTTTSTYSNPPVQITVITGVTTMNAGSGDSFVIKSDNTLWGWGDFGYGTLGDGTDAYTKTIAEEISGPTDAVAIAAGGHALTLKSDNTVWGWGDNFQGQLGNNPPATFYSTSTPVQVSDLTGVKDIAAGDSHSLALKSDNTVWAWGYNNNGQLGDGTVVETYVPVQVSSLTGVKAIAAGTYHSLGLKLDGTVWAWGYNNVGQLGDGTTTDRNTPVQVTGLSGVTDIGTGNYHSFALKSDGTVWAWGSNDYYGQLGDGTTIDRSTPVQVLDLTGIVGIAAGGNHSLALKSDGTVWSWGDNYSGQLGHGGGPNRTTPVQVSSLTGIVGIMAGGNHSLALKSDGTVWSWGGNSSGQLGDGTYLDRYAPVQVTGLTGVAAITTGHSYSVALLDPTDTMTAPTTMASPAGGVYGSFPLDVALSCEDGSGSGCATTYYTTDGSTPTTASSVYSTTLSLGDGDTLKFFSIDNNNNEEAVNTEVYTYSSDVDTPTTTASPVGGTHEFSVHVILTCNDGGGSGCANTYYTTDGSDPTTLSTVYSGVLTFDFDTTFRFFSKDNFGNKEAIQTEFYEVIMPTGNLLLINTDDAEVNQRAVKLQLICAGDCVDMRISNDNVNWTAWKPFSANVGYWTVEWGNGMKTVTVEIRDSLSAVTSHSKTIMLKDTSFGGIGGLLLMN